MDIVELNRKIENFIQQHDLSADAPALKQEHTISKPEEWQQVLDNLADRGRVLSIGIIGRVKAGKSSLLNALLFDGNDILPKAATPMTASLVIMQYGDTVKAEVDFFTPQDMEDIENKYQAYCKRKQALLPEKEKEFIDRAREKKQRGMAPASAVLTPTEEQECRDRARSAVEREMKNHPNYAAYDQYCRMQNSGHSLKDFQTKQTLEADSIEALMNGALNEFVGASGRLMPFTKSVTLHLPHPGLQGLRIIDTPGINDPVTSRGARTEELLQHCDVVWMVSPSGQFLSSEDTDLLHRITTQEGTQEAYLIASQVDNQMFGSARVADDPAATLTNIVTDLSRYARDVLAQQARQYPGMQTVAGKLTNHPVLHSSGVAHALARYFDQPDRWDENQKIVWKNLQQHYPRNFTDTAQARDHLRQMANMEQLHQVIAQVNANKTRILKERRLNFEQGKRRALQGYLKAWEQYVDNRIRQIETADVATLRQQTQALKNSQAKIELSVGGIYADLIDDIRLQLDPAMKQALRDTIRDLTNQAESAQGTTTEEYEAYVGKKWLFFDDYQTRTREINTVQTSAVRSAIKRVHRQLADQLEHTLITYQQGWRKKLYAQIVGALRQDLGDDGLDIDLLARVVKNIMAQVPEARFKLDDTLPSALKKHGKLEGDEADDFIHAATDYIDHLEMGVWQSINHYIRNLISKLHTINLVTELTGNLADETQKLTDEISNKEASLFRYQHIKQEIGNLQGAGHV